MNRLNAIRINRNVLRWVLLGIGGVALLVTVVALIVTPGTRFTTVSWAALGVTLAGLAGFVLLDPQALLKAFTGRAGQYGLTTTLLSVFFVAFIVALYVVIREAEIPPLDVSEGEGRRLMRVEYAWNRNRGRITREEGYVESAIPMMPASEEERRRQKRVKIRRGERVVLHEGVTRFSLRYVWYPMPEVRDYREPPPPEPPLAINRLEQYWGLPDALEVTLRVEPETKETAGEEPPFELTTLVPIRAPRQPRTRAMIEQAIGRASQERKR